MRRLARRLILLAPAVLLLAAAAPAGPALFRAARLNRAYGDVAPEILPVEAGPLTVRLSSPRNSITLRDHSLRLTPGPGGSAGAELHVEFSGQGWLVADVAVGGFATRLEDAVRVPPQAADLAGRLHVERVRGGYWLVPEQLPARLDVRLESGLGRRLVDWCGGLAALPFADFDCAELDRSLSTAVVPLPPAGEGFLLADSELTPPERRQLDDLLRSAR